MAVSAGKARAMIPAPNFDNHNRENAGLNNRPNPWIEAMNNQRSQMFASYAWNNHQIAEGSHERSSSHPTNFSTATTTATTSRSSSSTTSNNIEKRTVAQHYATAWNAGSNKGQRVDKRDLAENNVYFCDTCDRGFKTSDKYQEHVDQHEMCRMPGCKFIGAPKLVQIHYNMQHSNPRISKKLQLATEDIEKWREERKRNFPTAENIARKKQMLQERHDRGEVLDTRQFGRMQRGRGRGHGRGRGRGGHQQSNNQHTTPVNQMRQAHQTSAQGDPLMKVLECNSGSVGLTDHQRNIHLLNPSDDMTPPSSNQSPAASTAGALSSLAASYGDLSSEEEGEIRDEEITEPVVTVQEQKTLDSPVQCTEKATKADPTQPTCSRQHIPSPQENPSTSQQHGRKHLHQRHGVSNKPRKSTLLEKLLSNEIRHERNVLLQCVRHVVNENFFGIGAKKTEVVCSTTSSYNEDDEWT